MPLQLGGLHGFISQHLKTHNTFWSSIAVLNRTKLEITVVISSQLSWFGLGIRVLNGSGRPLDSWGSASHSLEVCKIICNKLLKLCHIIKKCVSTHGNHCANKTKILIKLLVNLTHIPCFHHFAQDALVQLLMMIS